MNTAFSVPRAELASLSPESAVDVIRRLLLAEARTLGVEQSRVNVPLNIDAKDGGIDAEIDAPNIDADHGIITSGLNCYQIKAGRFVITDTSVRAILFRNKTTQLKPRVEACLKKHGRLVVVLFGSDTPDEQDDHLRAKVREQLRRYPHTAVYTSARIDVWRQNQLIGFLERFPALALYVQGRELGPFQTHEQWSGNADMQAELAHADRQYFAGSDQQACVAQLRAALRGNQEAAHIHICGEAGIGKTRLVLEATSADDLAPLVLYCRSASQFAESSWFYALQDRQNPASVILVLDECPRVLQAAIWSVLMHRGPQMRLVTIFNEHEATTGRTQVLDVGPLATDQIGEIIARYGVDPFVVNRYAPLCSGSPRVAHMIGWNMSAYPGAPVDLLRPPDIVPVWDRYIAYRDDIDSLQAKQRRFVLQNIALFKRFGFASPYENEAAFIARLQDIS